MSTLKLNLLVVPTYDVNFLSIMDASTYPFPVSVSNPTIEITPPAFDKMIFAFNIQVLNIYDSMTLIGAEGELPDGIYQLKYSITPSSTNFVEKSVMRVDKLQMKFDQTFMSLDMMECDNKVKSQAKVVLNKIWLLIQGSISASNNCAPIESNRLYQQANKMLSVMLDHDCGCTNPQILKYY